MNIKIGTGSDGAGHRPDTVGASTEGASLPPGRVPPKRVGSFGKGLGMALANSMSKATEAVAKRSSNNAPAAPAASLATSTSMAPPPTPDASHLYNLSLRLSELVNQALASTIPQSQPSSGGMTSVTKHAPGRSAIPSIDQIIYEGRHLPNRAKVQEVAQTVVAELQYAKDIDAYLLRAVSRAALKALTLFATRIDALLVPVGKDPTSLIMPTTAKEGVHISPALEYNLGLATLTWIVEDALERCIEGDDGHEGMPGFVSEILTPVRKRMETTILHIIQPVLTGVKTSLTASILKGVRQPFVVGGSPGITPSLSLTDTLLPPLSPSNPPGSAVSSPKAGVGGTGDAVAINWLKELQGRLEGSRKLLVPRIEARTSQDGEGWFISVAVHVIWKALFIITARPIEQTPAAGGQASVAATPVRTASFWGGGGLVPHQHLTEQPKRNPSPGQISAALKSVASVGSSRHRKSDAPASSSGLVSPGATDTAAAGRSTPGVDGLTTPGLVKSGFSLTTAPAVHKAVAAQVSDLQAFQKLALRFCKGFVSDKALSAVAAELCRGDVDEEVEEDAQLQEEDEEDELARQALAEALEALKSTIAVIQVMDSNFEGVKATLERGIGRSPREGTIAIDGGRNSNAMPNDGTSIRALEPAQYRALKSIPPLLLLHIAYCRLPSALRSSSTVSGYLPSPPALFGVSWTEYERSIAGFVGGGTWAQAAVQRWSPEIESLLSAYQARRVELVAKRQFGSEAKAIGSEDHEDQEGGRRPDASRVIEGLPVPTAGRAPRSVSDDFGTTPTPARPAGDRQASPISGEGGQRYSTSILDASQATPRAVSDPPRTGEAGLARFSSRLDCPEQSANGVPASQHSSTVSSPAHSPSLDARRVDGDDDEIVESMEGSLASFAFGSPTASTTDLPSHDQTTSRGAPTTSTTGTGSRLQQQIEKSKFWKTSSSSSLASSSSSSTSHGNLTHQTSPNSVGIKANSPPAGSNANGAGGAGGGGGGGSSSSNGAPANASSTRGFHLPRALARASFGGSRPSSPAGSLRSLGVRSRSSRRGDTLPLNTSTGTVSSPVSIDVAGGSGVACTSTAALDEMLDGELAEVDRCIEALRFFARVVEWAAWGSGVDVSVKLAG